MKKQSTITGSYAECNDLIDQFKQNKLPLTSGCDMEGSLEAQVTGVLNNIRETASKVCPPTPLSLPATWVPRCAMFPHVTLMVCLHVGQGWWVGGKGKGGGSSSLEPQSHYQGSYEGGVDKIHTC